MNMSGIVEKPKILTEVVPISEKLENASALERIGWGVENFGEGLVMSSSFGAQSAVMLHMVSTLAPAVPIILVDTGYLFPETYQFIENLQRRLDLNLRIFLPGITAARQEVLYGKLWEQGKTGIEKYNLINKVEPMNCALKELGAKGWLSWTQKGPIVYKEAFRGGHEAGKYHQNSSHH
jgi:phosphoadenosine phosphosulfate reductase